MDSVLLIDDDFLCTYIWRIRKIYHWMVVGGFYCGWKTLHVWKNLWLPEIIQQKLNCIMRMVLKTVDMKYVLYLYLRRRSVFPQEPLSYSRISTSSGVGWTIMTDFLGNIYAAILLVHAANTAEFRFQELVVSHIETNHWDGRMDGCPKWWTDGPDIRERKLIYSS